MLPPECGPPPGFHDDEDDDGGPSDGDRVLADVRLARTAGMLTKLKLIFIDQISLLECKYPSDVDGLGLHIHEPSFSGLLRVFLNNQVGSDGSDMDTSDEDGDILDHISPISVFHSAIALFYALSDPSGLCGMRHECIRSIPSWQSSGPHHDCYESEFMRIRSYKHLSPQIDRERFNGVLYKL